MKEIPLMVKSYMISDYAAYRTHAYTRPGVAFYLLKDMLGEEDFNKALKAYVDRWKWKHPTPYDFFFTFENVLDRDLSWFWEPWFFEFGYPDLAIKEVDRSGSQYSVVVKKVGNMPVPVRLEIHYENGNAKVIEKKATVWKEGDSEYTVTFNMDRKIERIVLGSTTIPDINRENNIYK
jgi:aminopeptidase N